MGTTFEQARQLAQEINAPAWRDLKNPGEYMVAPWGYEDADAWLVVDGAREYLEGGDDDFEVLDKPLSLVMKDTGELFHIQYLEAQDRVDRMTDVGNVPALDE